MTSGEKSFLIVLMPKFVTCVLTFLLILASPATAIAQENTSSRIDLSINQGPGILLPTSPLYFADVFKNNLRLMLASYDNNQKANIHLDIAGERIAEVRVMIEEKKMPARALDMALASLSENIEGARTELKKYKGKGQNVEELAVRLNTTINAQKESLHVLQAKAGGEEASLKIKAKLAKVREIEREIEDEMPEHELANEVVRELELAYQQASDDAAQAVSEAANLKGELQALKPQTASESSPAVAGASEEKVSESKSGSGGSGSDSSGSGR